MDVNNLPQPPEGVLNPEMSWGNPRDPEKVWSQLKDQLTGAGKYSTVNLGDADSDRLIENLKKDPRGFPIFNYSANSAEFIERYEKYQKWLVDEYLEKPFRKQADKKIEDVAIESRLKEIQKEREIQKAKAKAKSTATATATATKEPSKSALVPTGGVNEADLITEKIDERILRILGLDDVVDIDYGTYKSLLKEQSVLISTGKSNLHPEEQILIQDEFERVKDKVGRFKVERKKITVDNVRITRPSNLIKNNFLLKGTSEVPDIKKSEEKKGPIKDIQKALDNILKSIVDQDKQDRKNAENERKKKEANKRKGIEEGMEKRFGAVQKIAQKLLSPVKSILDKIIDFFVSMLIGKVIYNLIDWIGKKENQDKLKSVLRFFKDYWPALLSAYFLFGTTLGGFIRTISGILIRGIAQFAAANPLAAGIIAGAAVMTGVGINEINQKKDRREQLFGKEDQSKPTQKSKEQQTKEGIITSTIEAGSFGAGQMAGLIGGGLHKVRQFFDNDGKVSGESGIDKIPAMLSDGEFVMSPGATQLFGVNTLETMNAMGGGTNRPRIIKGNTYAAGGGLIGDPPFSPLTNQNTTPINLVSSAINQGANVIKNIFSNKNDNKVPEKYGPSVPKFKPSRYVDPLVKAAAQMQKEQWGYREDPGNGCAPAINEVYNRAGLTLPWKGIDNIKNVPKIYKSLNKTFVKVSEDKRKPGDIVIWNDPRGTGDPEPYGHIGIVMPDGRIANNSSGRGTFTNLMTPEMSKAGWPGTKQLIYFRNPDVAKAYSSKPKSDLKEQVSQAPQLQPDLFGSLKSTIGSVVNSVFTPPVRAEESTIAPTKLNPSVNQITPPISSQPRVIVIPASKKSKPSSGSSKSQSVPNFSAIHPDGNSRTAKTLGIN